MTPLLLCQAGTRIPTRNAVAEERARIAREIHDIVSHGLGATVVASDAAATATSEPERAKEAMLTVRDTGIPRWPICT